MNTRELSLLFLNRYYVSIKLLGWQKKLNKATTHQIKCNYKKGGTNAIQIANVAEWVPNVNKSFNKSFKGANSYNYRQKEGMIHAWYNTLI